MGVSRTMWLRGINEDAAKMRGNARDERDERTKEITRKWKDGFKALKEENDRLQRENVETFNREIADIDAMTKSQIAQGPPRE
jgi:outer membrane biogenesis lipoprotein LolB